GRKAHRGGAPSQRSELHNGHPSRLRIERSTARVSGDPPTREIHKMKQAFVAAVAASVVCFSCSASVFAAADVPPEVRHPDFPHICDSGPMRGCPCTPTEADPNDICSDVPFDIPFFEGGPQCVPFVLSEPKGSALLTFIVDEHVIDYDQPDAPENQA